MAYEWMLMGDIPARAAELWGDHPALVFEDRRWTNAEFDRDVDRVAKGLIAAGVEDGDHVAVWMTNRPEWLMLMYAIPKVGGCIVPLNTRYRSDDVAYTAAQSESVLMVVLDESGPINYRELLAEARTEIEAAGFLRTIVLLGQQLDESTSWEDFLASGEAVTDDELAARAAAVTVDHRMMLAYTSGTTGHPKGVVHTHHVLRNTRERVMLMGHTRNDVHMSYLPLFHLFGFGEVALMATLTGALQVLFDVWDPEAVLDAVEEYGGTTLHGFDSHWADLNNAQLGRPRDVSSLRIGTFAAGQESSTPIARVSQDLFCPTISGFGMSETWPFVCASHATDSIEQRTEASGYPMDDVQIEIRDPETGQVITDGSPGALYVKSYTLMKGYWRKPDATAEVLRDGWLETGDLARIRPDGHCVFMGRYKDMLKVGGENVSPAEVEGYLLEVDGVEEIAVVGYPDPRLAEVPVAYVVKRPDSDVSGDALIERCQGRIASFKIPRHVLFIDAMPATPSGKIRKIELREWALRDLGNPSHG